MKTNAAILWEIGTPLERRGDRARPARAGRGAGEAGRLGPVPLRRAPRHRRPALRPADHRRPRGRRRGAGGRRRVSPGSPPATTSCSGSSRRAGAARAARPGTRTCATSAPRSASGAQLDGTSRHHAANGEDLGLMCMLGTFSEHTVVNEASCIKVDRDMPLDRACLLGCGVVTGWGSAASTPPRWARATWSPSSASVASAPRACRAPASPAPSRSGPSIPIESKREQAMQFGATHTASSLEEALPAIAEASWGRMANKVIMTMGVGDGEPARRGARHHRQARPGRRHQHPPGDGDDGQHQPARPHADGEAGRRLAVRLGQPPRRHPARCSSSTATGSSTSTAMVTQTYDLDGVNQGYDDMKAGKNIRGILLY